MEGTKDNAIFIGQKETMSYVLAVITQFNSGNLEVTMKARGRMISKAVDVAEIVRNKFLTNVKIKSITTSTEEVTSEDGKKLKVSAIEIVLLK